MSLTKSKKPAAAPKKAAPAPKKATPKQLAPAASKAPEVKTLSTPKGGKEKKAASSTGGKRVASSSRNGAEHPASESMCREVACEGLSTTGGYCRLHYIKNWKKIKRKELILKEKKLNQYIEELVAKYPDKYIEAIRQDLASDKDFAKVIYDLDLDEGIDDFDVEGESMESVIDTIRRDFDDEGEGF